MKKILFVDDDLVTQKVLSAALRASFEVIGETSGARVIERAETEKPNLILLDLSMPNIDGYEVLARLKRHPILATIPVICVSGKIDEESRGRAYRSGAAGFISKPIDVVQISQDVTHLLEAMNTEVESVDKARRVFIGRNSESASDQLREDLKLTLQEGRRAVIMSLTPGDSFFKTFDLGFIKTGQVLYLEIKSALIVRLPYLEDLSPIQYEIKQFLAFDARPVELFFEGPEQLLNVDQEKSVVTYMALSDLLSRVFQRVHFFSKYGSDEEMNRSVNQIAKLLVRVA